MQNKRVIELKGKIHGSAFENENELIRLELPSVPFDEGPEPGELDLFLEKYAEILWGHEYSMTQDSKNESLRDFKESAKENLDEDRKYLEDRGYSKNIVKAVMKLLEEDLAKRVERYPDTQDGKYHVFPGETPESDSWIVRENETIGKIRDLYNKYTPLRNVDRQIAHSMAMVFEAVIFWQHERKSTSNKINRYYERLIKRFNSVDKWRDIENNVRAKGNFSELSK